MSRVRSGFASRFLLATLVVAVALLVPSAPGLAAEPADNEAFLVHSCWPQPGPEGDGFDWTAYPAMRFCESEGLLVGFGYRVARGYSHTWEYSTNSQSALIRDLIMDVNSGEFNSGIVYSVAVCDGSDCETRSVLDRHNSGTWTVAALHATKIQIRATCEADLCAPQDVLPSPIPSGSDERSLFPSFLRVSKFRLLIEDSTPPVLTVYGASFGNGIPQWVRPGLTPLHLTAEDYGVGIDSAGLRVDSAGEIGETPLVEWSIENRCLAEGGYAYASPRLCPSGGLNTGVIDLRGLSDGGYTLRAGAVDGMGNRSAMHQSEFSVDSTPPARLRDLRVTSKISRFGWTSDPVLRVEWTDPINGISDGGSPIQAVRYDFDPEGAPSRPDPSAQNVPFFGFGELPLEGDGRWRAAFWVEDTVGNRSRESELLVGLDRDAPEPVQPDQIPWLSPQRLHDGYHAGWPAPPLLPDLESGVCGYAAEISDLPDRLPSERFDVESPETSFRLPADLPEGRHHLNVRSVSCAGVGSQAAGSTPIDVDATPPTAEATGIPRGIWSRSPIVVTVKAEDQLSGIDSISRTLNGNAVTAIGEETALEVGEGVHDLAIVAVDRAGNESDQITHRLHVDSTPPIANFQPRTPEAPGQIVANVQDAISGVDSAWIEVRRSGAADGDWRTLPSSVTGSGTSTDQSRVVADLPDSLPDCEYELRAIAVDRAGNVVDARSVRLSDALMKVTMPVRTRLDLSAELAPVELMRKSGRSICSRSAKTRSESTCTRRRVLSPRSAVQLPVDYPGRAALLVELATRRGTPVRNVDLTVRETVKGRDEGRELRVRTDDEGRARLLLPPGPSRNYTVSYAGSNQLAAARGSARLRVRAGVRFSISKRRVRVGERVRLSGRVLGAHRHPEGSVRVDFGFFRGDGYDQILDPVFTRAGGIFRYPPWQPGTVSRPTTYLLRARVERAYGWPYEAGSSSPVALIVVP